MAPEPDAAPQEEALLEEGIQTPNPSLGARNGATRSRFAALILGLLGTAALLGLSTWLQKPGGAAEIEKTAEFQLDDDLDDYRSDMSSGKQKPSWGEVACKLVRNGEAHRLEKLLWRNRFVANAQCSYTPILTVAMSSSNYNSNRWEIVKMLAEAGAQVTDENMVDAACSSEDDENQLLRILLKAGGNPNAQSGGTSPINCAASRCDDWQVSGLIQAGANPETKDRSGFTPFLNALNSGCTSMANEFLNHGVDINAVTNSGDNALQVACNKCMGDVARELLKRNLPVNHKNAHGQTALGSAVQAGCVSIGAALLDNPFTQVDEEGAEGKTVLFAAAERGQQELTKMLIDKGAVVNHKDKTGATPLLAAAKRGASCDVLLKNGADVNVVDIEGQFPLWSAADGGHVVVVRELLNAGSQPLINKPGPKGKSPLAAACWNTQPEVTQVLVEHGADVAMKDAYDQTPINLATQFVSHLNDGATPVRTTQSAETVDAWTGRQKKLNGVLLSLAKGKANLDTPDWEGWTPLLNLLRYQKNSWGVPAQAQSFGDAVQDNANLLILYGANPNLANRWSIAPLHLCAYNGYPKTAELLLQKGANRYAKNAQGKTPKQLCGGGLGQGEVARLLG